MSHTCETSSLLRQWGGLQRPHGINLKQGGSKWCISSPKVMPCIINTPRNHQTLAVSSSRRWRHHQNRASIQAQGSWISSLPCLWLFVVATSLILVKNKIRGTLPSLWASIPSYVQSWLNLLIPSPYVHCPRFRGCESWFLMVLIHWMVHYSSSYVPNPCNKGTMSWVQSQDVPQRTMSSPSKKKTKYNIRLVRVHKKH